MKLPLPSCLLRCLLISTPPCNVCRQAQLEALAARYEEERQGRETRHRSAAQAAALQAPDMFGPIPYRSRSQRSVPLGSAVAGGAGPSPAEHAVFPPAHFDDDDEDEDDGWPPGLLHPMLDRDGMQDDRDEHFQGLSEASRAAAVGAGGARSSRGHHWGFAMASALLAHRWQRDARRSVPAGLHALRDAVLGMQRAGLPPQLLFSDRDFTAGRCRHLWLHVVAVWGIYWQVLSQQVMPVACFASFTNLC